MFRTLKILFILLLCTVALLVYPTLSNAADKQVATSTINGINVAWEYYLNDAGQITNLVCTNASALSGNITIPSTLDGKTVVSLGSNSFKGSNITGVTIPDSVTEIGYYAFANCTKLTKVDLGSVTKLEFSIFKGCSSLTELTIPKTLKTGATVACLDNTNITKITFEDGLTVIPSYLCANTGITEITIPDSVTEIGYYAFANCTKLTKVDLGSVTKLEFSIFKGCSSLTELTIPKTLKTGATVACLDNTNITKITFEDGLTVIPSYLCANTGITEITIPDSVTEIDYKAFENCTKLTNVDLGSVTNLSSHIFTGCSSLTELTIPKTLKQGSTSPCLDNPNITKITFEDGLTVIPSFLCANTGITEITIPNSVAQIENRAFANCAQLTKITILDNVKNFFSNIFTNHNEDLTIYCYQSSYAAKYAIENNIKVVYLPKDESSTPSEDKNNQNTNPGTNTPGNTQTDNTTPKTDPDEDSTTASGKLPYTGASLGIVMVILFVVGGGIFAYKKYNNLKDI